MRVLVTGGTGFLGGHLISALLNQGMKVRVLARSRGESDSVEWCQGSILHTQDVATAMSGCEAVFHLAGRVSRDRNEWSLLRELHVEGTQKVCEAARLEGVSRVIYASTSGTVGVSRTFCPELNEDSPSSESIVMEWPYYATKLEAEQVALSFAREQHLPLICVNPSLLLGPGDVHGSSTGDVADILNYRVPALPSGSINFVDVRDVAATTVSLLHRGTPGQRYLLGGANWSLRQFVQEVARIGGVHAPRWGTPQRLTRRFAHASARLCTRLGIAPILDPISVEMSQVHWCFSSEKARVELGFTPRDPRDTLRDTVRDIHAS